MKRTRRTIKDSFPECSVPPDELRRIFADLRQERLSQEPGVRKRRKRRGDQGSQHQLTA